MLIFLFFRRMRAPLLVLVSAYAISIAGLVVIPGVDEHGNVWHFDFFHAFYFVSFMGSTIGFGEIPHEFSAAQRLWTTIALYICVISWLYAIGKILTLIQDPAFQRVVTEQRFNRKVQRLNTPFYLICGYGETGSQLIRALSQRNLQCVVIDNSTERINQLVLDSSSFDIPHLCSDAREIRQLTKAGLLHPNCCAVIALTNDDHVNVKIAITSKLLKPSLPVICRAQTQETAANLASFNTDHIINPFKVFADHLATALHAPSVDLLCQTLVDLPGKPLTSFKPPPRGTWIICGFGRFGSMVNRHLDYEGIPTTVIEPNPQQAPEGAVIGRGTEAVTLREADIGKAAGIIAGTDQDINNLSIIMTARELNPNLYFVARQNQRANDAIFQAARLHMVMDSSLIFVQRILPLLTTPSLNRFLQLARRRNDEWAQDLLAQIESICDASTNSTSLALWSTHLDDEQAPAISKVLQQGLVLKLHHLLKNPYNREQTLPCLPLLLQRGLEEKLLPSEQEELQIGDRILFCARRNMDQQIDWLLVNRNVLNYVISGQTESDSYLWKWWRKHYRSDHKL